MILWIVREPRPDAAWWPGRRLLAVVDAVIWPLMWVWLVRHLPVPVGLVGPFVISVAALSALARTHQAVWWNHRYRFTTWRWGKVLGTLLLTGFVMKLALLT